MAKKDKKNKKKKKEKKTEEIKSPEIYINDVTTGGFNFSPSRKFKDKHCNKFVESDLFDNDHEGIDFIKMYVKLKDSGLKVQNVSRCLSDYEIFDICQISKEKGDEDLITIICWSIRENELATLKTMEMALL